VAWIANRPRGSSLVLFAGLWILAPRGPSAGSLRAQDPEPVAVDPRGEPVRRIFEEALSGTAAFARLQELCLTAPHRLSGSPGAEEAVAWARDRMQEDGLENVRLEPCTVPRWERGRVAALELTSPGPARNTYLPVLALGGSVGTTRAGIEAEVVRVESLEALAALGAGVRGRIVFFDRPMDPRTLDPFDAYGGAVDQRAHGAVEAARHGAVAAIVRSMSLRLDDHPHTGAMRYEAGVERIPAAAVSTAGAERLAALLRAEKKVTLRLRLDCSAGPDVPSHNVVGEIRGSSAPEEIVLLGAHLDAWDVGQGAHDDGAGCVHVLEAMRVVRKLGLRPKRTLRAVLFMNEENGLRGGRAYREAHSGELARHLLAIETDRGGFSPRGFGTDAGGELLLDLRRIALLLDPAGAGALKPGDGGADISVLRPDGVPLMELLVDPQRYFDVHHCARDTLDTVNPRELALGAAALAAMAYAAADSGVRIERPGQR